MFLGKFTLFKIIVLMVAILRTANCINCYSCNSKQEKHCLDPFSFNYTGTNFKIVDCADEVATRQYISRIANVFSAVGIPMNPNAKYALNSISEQTQKSACQKVEIIDNNEHIIIRECAILSDIVCDSLKNESGVDSAITFCQICDSDHCNSSHKIFTSWNLLFMSILTYRVIL